jgi:hypothetical protein
MIAILLLTDDRSRADRHGDAVVEQDAVAGLVVVVIAVVVVQRQQAWNG